MKIGIVCEGDTLDKLVAEDFGHAPFFLIVDQDTSEFNVVKNEYASGQGAGHKVADAFVSMEVAHLICGGIGMHGMEILEDANIRVWTDLDDMTAEEAIKHVKERIEFEDSVKAKSKP